MANPTTYPDTFPSKEITDLVTYLRGGGGDLKTLVHDGYTLEGYALGLTVGNPKAAAAQKAAPPLDTNEQKAAALEGLLAQAKGAKIVGFVLPGWLLTLAIQIVSEVLQKLLGG